MQENAEDTAVDVKIGFILLHNFTLHKVAELIDPIRFAADTGFTTRQVFCRWEWMTCDNQPVTASCGIPVSPTAAFNLDKEWDYVVLAGGLVAGRHPYSDGLSEALRKVYARKIPIITLCSGSFVVARAGLLDGKRCAIHFAMRDEFKQRFPKTLPVVEQSYIHDGGIITTSGGTTIELAIDIIQRHCGELRAQKALRYMMAEVPRTRKPPQSHLKLEKEIDYEDDLVRRAIAYMKRHLDAPVPLHKVTESMQVSTRRLNQAFLRSTGETAAVHWRKLRLEQARKMMIGSRYTIDVIAQSCGFSGASHLINWFQKQYGETPASFRRRRREAARL